jgi:hypothetical protein
MSPLSNIARLLDDAVDWVRLRTTSRNHVVDTGLGPGWYDEDELILHACMALLGRHIEQLGGVEQLAAFSKELRADPDPNEPPGISSAQADRQDEACAIWRWWTTERPADHVRRDTLRDALYRNRHISTRPTENQLLVQLVFPPLSPADAELEAEYRALEDKIDSDEQAMLRRLVEIRRSLWT